MKTLIIEDKEYIRKGLINLLKLIETDIQLIGECESVKDSVIVANACKPELVFLDINLTDGSAFDFIDQTTNLSYKIIFITAYEEYALKALKIGAIDYLLKPVDIDELKSAIDKVSKKSIDAQKQQIKTVKNALSNKSNTLILSFQDSFQLLDLNDLMYCESDKGYTTFYLIDGKSYVASKSLKEFEEHLEQQGFIRPHQSFMVNLNFIDKYDKSGIIYLKSGTKIPVSSRKKDTFLSHLLNRE